MREAGDVIALEQRGVGLSEPNLDCPGTLGFPLTSPGDRMPLLAVFNKKSRECAAYWRTRGIDLMAYNVVQSAHNVNSLRQALGVEKVRLWGSSYGTTLGLDVIRYYGANVDGAVLAGVDGPNDTLKLPSTAERQLRTLAKLVVDNPSLRHEIPDLKDLVRRVLAAAEANPFIVPFTNAKSKSTTGLTLGRFDFEQLVISMLGDVCPAWGVPSLPAHDRTPVHSDVPTLFISGTLDGRTPPENAQEVRRGFPHSYEVLIEGAGHGNDLFVSSPDIQKVMVEFMETRRIVENRITLPLLRFR